MIQELLNDAHEAISTRNVKRLGEGSNVVRRTVWLARYFVSYRRNGKAGACAKMALLQTYALKWARKQDAHGTSR